MSRYIDADARDRTSTSRTIPQKYKPTADVVEVVRCKDCNHWIDRECQIFGMMMNDDDYCCYGESTSWS